MKLPCEIVRDLLPLYQDQVCSGESKIAVEAHVMDCSACTAALKDIRKELNTIPTISEEEVDAKEAMKALSKRWKRSKIMLALTWALLAVGLTVLCFWAYNTLCATDNTPTPASHVELVYLYRTPDGTLNLRLRFTDGKRSQGTAVHTIYQDDQGIRACYMTLLRPRIIIQTMPNALVGEFGIGGFTDADTNMRLYYGTPEDHFLVWEPGMDVPVMTEKEAAARWEVAANE